MYIKKLILNNYQSYKETTLFFPEGICGIVGQFKNNKDRSNGSGKSSIIESFLYNIFDFSRTGSTNDLVRNSTTQMCVDATYDLNNEELRIIRAKDNKKNSIELYVNNEERHNIDSITDTQNRILRMISMNRQSFENSVCIMQHESDGFVKSTPTVMRNYISNIFGHNFYDLCADNTNDKLKETKANKNALIGIIDDYKKYDDETHLNNLESKSEEYKDLMNKYEKLSIKHNKEYVNSKTKLSEIEATTELKDNYKKQIKDKRWNLEEISNEIEKTKTRKIELEKDEIRLKNKITKITEKLNNMDVDDSKIDESEIKFQKTEKKIKVTEAQLHRLQNEYNSIKDTIRKFDELSICPTCEQEVKHGYKTDKIDLLKEELKNRKFETKETMNELEKLALKSKEYLQVIEQLKDMKTEKLLIESTLESTIEKFNGMTNSLKEKTNNLIELEAKKQKLVKDIKNLKQKYSEIDVDDTGIDSLKIQINNQLQSYKKYDSRFKEELKNYEHTKSEIKVYYENNEKLLSVKKQYKKLGTIESIYDTIKQGFTSIKNDIVDSTFVNIENNTNEILSDLSYSNFEIVFNGDPDAKKSKSPLDIVKNGKLMKYKSLSGGERTIVNFAIHLGVSNCFIGINNARPQFIFLDEIFASIDKFGREKIFEILNYLSNLYRQIFVISHVPEINNSFPNTILVEYDGEISDARVI